MSFLMCSPGGRVPVPVTTTYRYASSSSSNTGPYTFASATLGPATTKVVVVGVSASGGGTCRTITSVTLGGVAMTAIRNLCDDGGTVSSTSGLYYYETASSSANIVVTFPGGRENCAIRVFSVQGDYTSAAPASSAIKLMGSVGACYATGGTANSGIAFAGCRAGSALYPTIINTGGTFDNSSVENNRISSAGNCDTTTAYLNSTSPSYGYLICATWA